MPASVGFSLGIDRAPVVSIVGDGAALLFSPQALWTAAREKLPVTFVVVNNREYNMLKKYMRSQAHSASVRDNRFIAMDFVDPAIDFLALAASMGVSAHRIERAADIATAIEAGIFSGVPNFDRDSDQRGLKRVAAGWNAPRPYATTKAIGENRDSNLLAPLRQSNRATHLRAAAPAGARVS